MASLARWDGGGRLEFLSLHDAEAARRYPDLSHNQLMAQIYVIDIRGRRHGGHAALSISPSAQAMAGRAVAASPTDRARLGVALPPSRAPTLRAVRLRRLRQWGLLDAPQLTFANLGSFRPRQKNEKVYG